jgi:hypothetical protein
MISKKLAIAGVTLAALVLESSAIAQNLTLPRRRSHSSCHHSASFEQETKGSKI